MDAARLDQDELDIIRMGLFARQTEMERFRAAYSEGDPTYRHITKGLAELQELQVRIQEEVW